MRIQIRLLITILNEHLFKLQVLLPSLYFPWMLFAREIGHLSCRILHSQGLADCKTLLSLNTLVFISAYFWLTWYSSPTNTLKMVMFSSTRRNLLSVCPFLWCQQPLMLIDLIHYFMWHFIIIVRILLQRNISVWYPDHSVCIEKSDFIDQFSK